MTAADETHRPPRKRRFGPKFGGGARPLLGGTFSLLTIGAAFRAAQRALPDQRDTPTEFAEGNEGAAVGLKNSAVRNSALTRQAVTYGVGSLCFFFMAIWFVLLGAGLSAICACAGSIACGWLTWRIFSLASRV